MLIFTKSEELSKLDRHEPGYPLVEELLKQFTALGSNYNWREHGFICFLETYDTDRIITELSNPIRLIDIPLFEYVEHRNSCYTAVYLQGDNTSYGFVLKDDLLTEDLRNKLASYL